MTIVVTNDTGGTAQPLDTLYIPPDRQVPDAGSQTKLADAGVDAAFVADLLSACLAHERCGAHLYRSVAGRTADPELRAQYEHFGEETRDHVDQLEQLIAATGGDPQYVSLSARATEKGDAGLLESTYLLGGSVDPITAELVMLEAVLLAEAKDHGNWELLALLAEQMAEGDVRDQLQATAAEVLAQEEEHLGWARQTRAQMLLQLATAGSTKSASSTSAGKKRSASSTKSASSKSAGSTKTAGRKKSAR